MKITYSTLLLSIALLALTTCKKKENETPPATTTPPVVQKPTACFTMSKEIVKPLETAIFTNCSKNYEKVEWYFGDGVASTLSDPSHQYTSSGKYNVRLKIFKDTIWADTNDSIIVGNKTIFELSGKVESNSLTNNELLRLDFYWHKVGTSSFNPLSSPFYLFGQSSNTSSFVRTFDTSIEKSDFEVKIVAKRFANPNSHTLPDVLVGMDSVMVSKVNPVSNPVFAKKNFTISFAELSFQMSGTYSD
ncbi:MAG: PKD domain-containing protein [Bacteroidia bacterium]|nr:PKD domain-containing protein [Bacteroidia bacterium]